MLYENSVPEKFWSIIDSYEPETNIQNPLLTNAYYDLKSEIRNWLIQNKINYRYHFIIIPNHNDIDDLNIYNYFFELDGMEIEFENISDEILFKLTWI